MVVLDASVAAKLILPDEDRAEIAADLADRCAEESVMITAPPLLASEVTNILRQRMRRFGLPLATARQLLADFFALPITLTAPTELYDRALEVAHRDGLPATYDAQYLALAEVLGCTLWTDDQRLLQHLAGRVPSVKWLGDYSDADSL